MREHLLVDDATNRLPKKRGFHLGGVLFAWYDGIQGSQNHANRSYLMARKAMT